MNIAEPHISKMNEFQHHSKQRNTILIIDNVLSLQLIMMDRLQGVYLSYVCKGFGFLQKCMQRI